MATGERKQLPKSRINLRIVCDDPPLDRGQEIAGVENCLAGRIDMHDAANRIHKAYPRADAIERVGENRSLRGLISRR